jgi:hypothetical protein
MSNKQISIPAELVPDFEAWGQLTAEVFGKLRATSGMPPRGVSAEDTWFWSKAWQSGEHEVDKALANGEYQEFNTVDELLADLHQDK